MLRDILNTFKIVTGYDPDSNPNVRLACLNYINRAAIDLYNGLESDSVLREAVFEVTSNSQVTLPAFVGELRAAREFGGYALIKIESIGVPRFTSNTWQYRTRNFTFKGKQPVCNSIVNASILTLMVNTVETVPVQVTITGSTINSKQISETVTMDAVSKQTLNSFQEIRTISSPTLGRTYDITILDINGNTLAVLYNTDQKTEYNLLDVSRYQWSAQTGDGVTVLAEILYKPRYIPFYNDTDEFHASGFDDGIAYKAIELWCQGQDGKEGLAMEYRAKAYQVINNAVEAFEKGEIRKLVFDSNPIYDVSTSMNSGWASRKSGRWGRYNGRYR